MIICRTHSRHGCEQCILFRRMGRNVERLRKLLPACLCQVTPHDYHDVHHSRGFCDDDGGRRCCLVWFTCRSTRLTDRMDGVKRTPDCDSMSSLKASRLNHVSLLCSSWHLPFAVMTSPSCRKALRVAHSPVTCYRDQSCLSHTAFT